MAFWQSFLTRREHILHSITLIFDSSFFLIIDFPGTLLQSIIKIIRFCFRLCYFDLVGFSWMWVIALGSLMWTQHLIDTWRGFIWISSTDGTCICICSMSNALPLIDSASFRWLWRSFFWLQREVYVRASIPINKTGHSHTPTTNPGLAIYQA